MKQLTKLASLALLSAIPFVASADYTDWFFQPFLGIEGGSNHTGWEDNYGKRHFVEYSGQADGYIGVRIHQYIGLEGGYFKSFPRDNHEYYGRGEPVLGWIDKNGVANAFDSLHHSSMQMDGAFYGIMGFLPVFESTTLFIRLGAAHLDMHFQDAWIDSLSGSAAPALLDVTKPIVNWQAESKHVLRVGFGIQQKINDILTMHAYYTYLNTSKLEATTPFSNRQGIPTALFDSTDFLTAKPKDTHTFGIGFSAWLPNVMG